MILMHHPLGMKKSQKYAKVNIMLSRRSFIAMALSSAIALSASSAWAKDFGKDAEGFVQSFADNAIASFRSMDPGPERDKEFRRILNDGFDVRAIGKWVLGRYWRKAKDDEKEEYLSLFEDFIVVTYSLRFEGYSGSDITLNVTESITKNDNDAIVRSQIKRPQSNTPILVDWRVKSNTNNQLKVVDVVVAGVSMSQAQRSEFSSVIKNSNGKISGLIKALKNKTAQLASKVNSSADE